VPTVAPTAASTQAAPTPAVILPSTGGGPGNDSPRWLPVTWLLLAAGSAFAAAGVIRRRAASRAQHMGG
jgi:hypothetical protein